jgi:hypothetical protein
VAIDDPSGKSALYQRFFQRLIDDLRDKHGFTNARVGSPQNWHSFSSGTRGFTYAFSPLAVESGQRSILTWVSVAETLPLLRN